MNDYISREAALKELLDWCVITGYGGLTKTDVIRAMENVPAADVVEVVHGSPVKVFDDPRTGKLFTTCSRCDGKISPKDKWCKHCGAKMNGGADNAAD